MGKFKESHIELTDVFNDAEKYLVKAVEDDNLVNIVIYFTEMSTCADIERKLFDMDELSKMLEKYVSSFSTSVQRLTSS